MMWQDLSGTFPIWEKKHDSLCDLIEKLDNCVSYHIGITLLVIVVMLCVNAFMIITYKDGLNLGVAGIILIILGSSAIVICTGAVVVYSKVK